MIDDEELSEAYNLGYSCAKDMAMEEITRLRAENEKLREELEEMREACQANYMLGVERGKQDARDIAAAALKEIGNGRD